MTWTQEQLSAIEQSSNLIVSAAAGSGKTAVITERVIRHVREGFDIERILVVTFTKAAAAEMKKRISKGLSLLSDETGDPSLQKRLREQAQNAEHANISTIHSFCTRVLKRHFYEARLDPSFRPAENTQTAMMKADAMDELIEERFEFSSPEFLELVGLLDGEENIAKQIFELYHFMVSHPDPESYLSDAVENFSKDARALAEYEPYGWLAKHSAEMISGNADRLQALLSSRMPVKLRQQLDDELLRVRALKLYKGYDEYREALCDLAFNNLQLKYLEDDELRASVKKTRDDLKKTIAKHKEWFRRSLAEEAEVLNSLYPAMKELQRLIWEFDEKYRNKKTEAGVIDYNDMEHLTLKVLENRNIADEYRRKFDFIFVDEYQDINEVQESIINAVKRENNVFMVGDVKQSIYRFRLAEPRIFLNKYRKYANKEKGEKLDLNVNFRSTGNVINAVNKVFSKIMREHTGEIDYDKDAALVMGRDLPELSGIAELHILEKNPAETADKDNGEPENEEEDDVFSDEADEQELSDAQAEALLAAKRIKQLTDENSGYLLHDPKDNQLRKYKYSDFAVLLRANNTVEVWAQVFSMEGIPSFSQVTGGYFAAVEVNTVMALLRIIDNKRQDIPLLSVLRSPIGGFDVKELALIREDAQGESVYDSLYRVSNQKTDLGAKAKKFLDDLSRWKEDSQLFSVEQLIGALMDETGYYHYVGALAGGAKRQANIDALIQRAHEYERSAGRGLWSFIRFMDSAKQYESFGEAQVSAQDVVNICTVHKSKGLEYPVVIFAGLGKQWGFNQTPCNTDREWGFGLSFYKNSVVKSTVNLHAIKEKAKKLALAEEMRVLYVGMTRAREHLILIGSVNNIEKSVKSLDTEMTDFAILSAKCFMDWIIGALLRQPEGRALRSVKDSSHAKNERIRIFCHPRGAQAFMKNAIKREEFEAWAKEAEKANVSAVDERFSWKYPFEEEVRLPGKTSVSALSHKETVIVEAPSFARSKTMGATDKGTAAHMLMQRIRLIRHTPETVRAELQRLKEQGFITNDQAQAVDIGAIVRFFDSPLGMRLLASNKVERELEFNHSKPASELFDTRSAESVLLQGVIDCAFLENGGWVLLDYKTDYVPEGTEPKEAAQKHRLQVELYKKALGDLTGIPVKEAYIHLLRIGESVKM
ncbi:MAG: ATP-dependent helicase/nuclease subunit A [Firmicutes bacterium ADurb.Bin182]|nr:MAG: ATP-dependent helicase/nuclease subunit A [Firmicutes bacterium ADurb.Bin182]